MKEQFSDIFKVGEHANSLGRSAEVIDIVLKNPDRLNEVYECMFHEDAWVRMRAADVIEKICRTRPDWLEPYIDKFIKDLSGSTQASILWHLAQIYSQVNLTNDQRKFVINWLKNLISTKDVDWIVSANTMDTLAKFVDENYLEKSEFIKLLNIQTTHKSNAVIKRANKYLIKYSNK